ncbi:Conserved_hypothetical protein [Hexamita inflata]|uniref:Uncharacterized protein n=1 Tax=Hexamita inflata TaxID=28002 RepID=A0AA86UVV1_9EUKA|nr:Conserved hypothetical protein [Hexamita inflata]CAI9966716.1 Conserved hypothetical protein [Hexamita inflata]
MLFAQILTYQVFSIAEFDFCYSFVFQSPFQQKMQLVLTDQFTFERKITRDRTDNVLFQQVNQSVFSVRIDAEFNLNAQPFSLFFYILTNLTVVDTDINMRLINSSNYEFAFLVATVPEYSLEIRGSSLQFDTKTYISSFYGIANNLTELLTINRSSFAFNCMTSISKFHGVSGQVQDLKVLNSSFQIQTSAATSCGFVNLALGNSLFQNLTLSGTLSGANTYGFMFENRGACRISNVTYSLVTSGSASACAFVQQSKLAGVVTTDGLVFAGFSNTPLISQFASYSGLSCPCKTGATLESGLCYCAAGSVPTADNCSCSTKNAFISNKACVCGVNATNSSNTCSCPTGSSLVNGICQCATKNAFPVGGVCQCAVNASNTSNTCNCPSGSTLVNGVCKCSMTNSFPNAANTSCVCPTDATNNTATNTCDCPQYSTFVVAKAACICQPAYTAMSSKQCICSQTLLKGSTMNNGVCKCPYTAVISGNTCQCTKSGSSLEGTVCRCTEDQSGGWVSQGNYWCANLGRCCTDCVRSGWSYWCQDQYFQYCTAPNGDVIQ